jgi:hypothetical protein
MDVGSIAAAMVGAQAGRTQMAVAAKMMKMNADSAAQIVQFIESSQQNLAKMASAAAGIGQNLDITV